MHYRLMANVMSVQQSSTVRTPRVWPSALDGRLPVERDRALLQTRQS